MSKVEFNYNLEHLNRVLDLLPPALPAGESKNSWSTQFSYYLDRIITAIQKVWNSLFGDKIWYDESIARNLVDEYVTCIQKNNNKPFDLQIDEKMQSIYERLFSLASETEDLNWAAGLTTLTQRIRRPLNLYQSVHVHG